MSRRFAVSLLTCALLLSATAALSAYRLAGSGETLSEAAIKLLATLTGEQRSKAVVAFDDKTRTDWHFIPKADGAREGVKVGDMNDEQRKAAHVLLKAALSEAGYG
jgi:hypothetical protein